MGVALARQARILREAVVAATTARVTEPGDPVPYAATPLDRIRAEQARTLYQTFAVGTISSGIAALAIALGLAWAGRVDPTRAAVWSGMMLASVATHMVLRARYFRAVSPDAMWAAWLRRFTAIAFIEGVVWGIGALWLTSAHDLSQELLLVTISIVMASGAITVFQANLPTYLFYFFPTMVPHLGIMVVNPYPLHLLMALLLAVYLIAMPMIARSSHRQLVENLRLRFENIDIAEDLRQQKAFAEEANLAKSRFLAAASHDLRQPIHALNLFVGAMRCREMDIDLREMVEHIAGSVTAMDDLFAALLDISKLDAAAMLPRFEPIAIAPLLARLCSDHTADSAAKSIRLTLVPSVAIVWSDAVMLERTLRNLISNAVRYTDRGRVLVGCRSRGKHLAIEIWDTGRGIDVSQHERIFEEFYQIDNPERDRSKGLGLGLAIVRRMTALLKAKLTFTSRPGIGSLFRLEIPMATDQHPAIVAAPPPVAVCTDGLILVIDDEAAIQVAMSIALRGWGYEVIAAGSGDEIRKRIVEESRRPDLIVCDYRLRAGESGTEVIASLRSDYNHDIPALLITGDTAPGRISDAMLSGLPLLHKPVTEDGLRAKIADLLATPVR